LAKTGQSRTFSASIATMEPEGPFLTLS
jgi:hypothetical protein